MSHWIERAKDFIKGYPDQAKHAAAKDNGGGEQLGTSPDTEAASSPHTAAASVAAEAASDAAPETAPNPAPTVTPERTDLTLDDGPS